MKVAMVYSGYQGLEKDSSKYSFLNMIVGDQKSFPKKCGNFFDFIPVNYYYFLDDSARHTVGTKISRTDMETQSLVQFVVVDSNHNLDLNVLELLVDVVSMSDNVPKNFQHYILEEWMCGPAVREKLIQEELNDLVYLSLGSYSVVGGRVETIPVMHGHLLTFFDGLWKHINLYDDKCEKISRTDAFSLLKQSNSFKLLSKEAWEDLNKGDLQKED